MSKERDKDKKEGNPPPSPVSTDKCTDFQAQVGAEVTFLNITGTCSITKGNTKWPFSWGPPIPFPGLDNPAIYIASDLTVGNVYQYVVSCCSTASAPHNVTIKA
jgi:hypothetical protein